MLFDRKSTHKTNLNSMNLWQYVAWFQHDSNVRDDSSFLVTSCASNAANSAPSALSFVSRSLRFDVCLTRSSSSLIGMLINRCNSSCSI